MLQTAPQLVHTLSVDWRLTSIDNAAGKWQNYIYAWIEKVLVEWFLPLITYLMMLFGSPNRPTPQGTSNCPNSCHTTYCNACYYSPTPRRTPGRNKCIRKCGNEPMHPECLKNWADCVEERDRSTETVRQLVTTVVMILVTFSMCSALETASLLRTSDAMITPHAIKWSVSISIPNNLYFKADFFFPFWSDFQKLISSDSRTIYKLIITLTFYYKHISLFIYVVPVIGSVRAW